MIDVNQNAHEYLSGRLNSLPDFLHSIHIKNVCFDSRDVTEGDCYIALPSVAKNESTYVKKAIELGATLVIYQQGLTLTASVPCVSVPDVMLFSGRLLHEAFGGVTEHLAVVGVTGTNGKSSICYYLAQVAEMLSESCAVMGTLGYGKWNDLTVSGMTTLPLEKLHTVLNALSENNTRVAMEVSSHGLEQKRLAGVNFETAIFSNLTRDHLDYHGTMEAYGAEKSKLFSWEGLQLAVVNRDDDFSQTLMNHTTAPHQVTYGQSNLADLRFTVNTLNAKGMNVTFFWAEQSSSVQLPLYGEFNAYNVAAVIAYFVCKGFEFSQVVSACEGLLPVLGRMQQVIADKPAPLVLVDYAHTPDALQQVLNSVKRHNDGCIVLVVGCGGDRDQGKRPLMGQIAVENATKVIFTSDNPRNESPEKICKDMTRNLKVPFDVELDRAQAIKKAILLAGKNDVVLIAGKGHEDYQEIGGQRHYFSDVSVAEQAMRVESFT